MAQRGGALGWASGHRILGASWYLMRVGFWKQMAGSVQPAVRDQKQDCSKFPRGHLSRSAQAALTERPAGLNNRLFFSQLGSGKPKSRVPASLGSAEDPLLGLHTAGLLLSSHAERFGVSSSSSKDTSPVGSRPHPYDLI